MLCSYVGPVLLTDRIHARGKRVVPQGGPTEECHLSHLALPRPRRHTLAWIAPSPKPVSRSRTGTCGGEPGCEATAASVLIFWASAGHSECSPVVSSLTAGGTRCAGGGIGRRAGFRFQCPKGRGGSTPPSRTQRDTERVPVSDEKSRRGPLLVGRAGRAAVWGVRLCAYIPK